MIPFSCDTMVALGSATANGQTIFAKNSDRPKDECQPLELRGRRRHSESARARCQYLTIAQAEETFRHIGSRPHWCWGHEHGFNEHQVVIGNEGLSSKFEFEEPKLIGMELLRLGLERGRTASEAVEVIAGLISTHGQGKFSNDEGTRTYDNGYIVADPNEAYVIETAGHHWAVKEVQDTIGISNVYSVEEDYARLSPTCRRTAEERGWWDADHEPFSFADAFSKSSDRSEGSGAMRRARSCAVLNMKRGDIDTGCMMDLLSDHSDGKQPEEPFRKDYQTNVGICVHSEKGVTAASLVADLCADGSRLPIYWCSFYSPCLGVFFPVFIEGRLPEALGVGESQQSWRSPWWRFHKLAHLASERPEERRPVLDEEWSGIQQQFFGTAARAARTGRELLDKDQLDDAEAHLTEFMEESVNTVLDKTSELLERFT
ncbi:MAG: C69 family dipeptidase [Planctomycetota bacterium]|nr:C69 family dipeptidase [Planctomycetota bacterium]